MFFDVGYCVFMGSLCMCVCSSCSLTLVVCVLICSFCFTPFVIFFSCVFFKRVGNKVWSLNGGGGKR